ncbi:hypothetical protein FJ462_14385 [Mesorhizobium sp. B2-6-7]|nr:hypothetical protein FJ462_14385 [Mesorhizobium sp. B2-6-7]
MIHHQIFPETRQPSPLRRGSNGRRRIVQAIPGFIGRGILDRDYTNLLSHLKKGHGIGNRTLGFTRILPSDKNLVAEISWLVEATKTGRPAWRIRLPGGWNDENCQKRRPLATLRRCRLGQGENVNRHPAAQRGFTTRQPSKPEVYLHSFKKVDDERWLW